MILADIKPYLGKQEHHVSRLSIKIRWYVLHCDDSKTEERYFTMIYKSDTVNRLIPKV